MNVGSNQRKLTINENEYNKKISTVSSVKDIQDILDKNPSNKSLQALKVIMEEEEKIVNIISMHNENNYELNKLIRTEIDLDDPLALIESNKAIDDMINIQSQQMNIVESILDKNNEYFPGNDLVEEMKKKQEEQSNQIQAMLSKISMQKSQKGYVNDSESLKK